MLRRVLLWGPCRWCFVLSLVTVLTALMPLQKAYGQNLEFSGGWAHMTGDNGTNGFEAGAAWWFNKRVTLALNYDGAYNTSSLTTFAITPGGLVTTKSHLQNLLIGPRIFFTTKWTDKHKLNPFGEVQFGHSWLNQEAFSPTTSASASDNAFSWMLGGGAEYLFSPNWSGRLNLDFLRTHFAEAGQSHLRFVLGVAYTLGKRGPG